MPENKEKERVFTFYCNGTFKLKTSDIWPDGDSPEDPSVEDVISRTTDVHGEDTGWSEWETVVISVSHENDVSRTITLTKPKEKCQNSQ